MTRTALCTLAQNPNQEAKPTKMSFTLTLSGAPLTQADHLSRYDRSNLYAGWMFGSLLEDRIRKVHTGPVDYDVIFDLVHQRHVHAIDLDPNSLTVFVKGHQLSAAARVRRRTRQILEKALKEKVEVDDSAIPKVPGHR